MAIKTSKTAKRRTQDTLLTSDQAAGLLRVGESSVKRWADEGALPCERTAGGHRRFTRAAVEDFRRAQRAASSAAPGQGWLELLMRPGIPHAVQARLLEERQLLGSWWRVADVLLPVVQLLADGRQQGTITLLEECLAAEQLMRGLQAIGNALPASPSGPRALLTPSEHDEHALHLALAELCLRELAYVTLWTGRRAPVSQAAGAGASHGASLLVLSASERSRDAAQLASQALMVGRACRLHGAALFLVGPGPWPEQPGFGQVFREHRSLHHAVQNLPAP